MPDLPVALRQHFRQKVMILFLGLFLLPSFLANVARADLILELDPASLSANAGGTVTLMGKITNTTGVTLNATDMFLNFSGYDPTVFTNVTQLLGTPDFALPDHHISPLVDLFSVTIAPTASPGNYTLDVVLQDVFNNSSPVVTAAVQIANVPEPSTWLLSNMGVAGVILFVLVDRRKKASVQRARA